MKKKLILFRLLLTMLLCLVGTNLWADLPENCFCITTNEYMTVSYSDANALLYSLDEGNSWSALTSTEVHVDKTDKMYIKAAEEQGSLNGYKFSIKGNASLSGNIMTLLNENPSSATMDDMNAFREQFKDCTGIVSAADLILPSTGLKQSCFLSLFEGCTNMVEAPALPAQTLAVTCYDSMFKGCTSLAAVPEISATTLAGACCRRMFQDCTNLVMALTPPTTRMEDACYNQMFSGCKKLCYLECKATDNSASGCTTDWLDGVASKGLLVCDASLSWSDGGNGLPEGWNRDVLGDLCLTSHQDGSTVSFGSSEYLLFSTNGTTWETLKTKALPLNNGQKMYVKASKSQTDLGAKSFSITGDVSLSGNIMSLLNQNVSAARLGYNAFIFLFQNCVGITTAADLLLPPRELKPYCYKGMFEGCTNLKVAPELPATTLSEACYTNMFHGCTGLTTAPELPATTLASWCYYYMFHGCTGLTTAPELPATALADNCYYCMFEDCTGLTTAPKLPATALAHYCYSSMFEDCTGLTAAPELPATILAGGCYVSMFYGCTSLITAPKLPVTTLANNCYESMFDGCTSLTTAPVLPATTLADNCYKGMFAGCTSLHYVECWATDISAKNCTSSWMIGVAPTGFFVGNGTAGWTSGVNGIPSGWNTEPSAGLYITTSKASSVTFNTNDRLQYSLDNGVTWATLNDRVDLPADGKMIVKVLTGQNYDRVNGKFIITGDVTVSGNIMALLNEHPSKAVMGESAFSNLFLDCSVSSAADLILPATTLTKNCYYQMFKECTSLTTPPALPATTLAECCYTSMFNGCTSLASAPELPAKKATVRCYEAMFFKCTNLTTPPELPATTLASECYSSMFWGCTSLATAPALPAPSLDNFCYYQMFCGCTNLNYVECMATDIIAGNSTTDWLDRVAGTGTFVCNPSTAWTTGAGGIPEGWNKNAYKLTVGEKQWASLCLPFAATIPEGATAYYISALTSTTATLSPIAAGETIPAGEGVLVSAAAGDYLFALSAETPVTITNSLQGTTAATACEANSMYVLNTGQSSAGAPVMSPFSGTSIPAFKAYLPVSALPAGVKLEFQYADGTAVSGFKSEASSDAIYNLAGQRVIKAHKGIQIANGKKVLVK